MPDDDESRGVKGTEVTTARDVAQTATPIVKSERKKDEEHVVPIPHHGLISFILWWLEDQWFLIALALVIVVASQAQVPALQQETKNTVVSYLCVSLIFLLTGLTLPTRVLLSNYSRWKVHLFTQVQCFLMTSAVAFGIVSAAASNANFMDPGLLIGLIFMGCVATTISSNVVMTRSAGGNVALTVVQSTVGNFLGPFVTPALVRMYTGAGAWYTDILPKEQGGYTEVYRRVFKQLGLSIFVPMIIGQIFQNLFPNPIKSTIERYRLTKLSSLALLIIIWSTYDGAFRSQAFSNIPASNMIFIVFVSIGLFMFYLGVCFTTSVVWLEKKDVISVCYCVPGKTPAMGVPLTNVMYVGLSAQVQSRIAMPMVIYQGLQIFAGSLLTLAFHKWIRKEKEAEERRKADLENGASRTNEGDHDNELAHIRSH